MSSGSNGFVDHARAFCTFVESDIATLTLAERLVQTQAQLLRLYQAAFSLPLEPPCGDTEIEAPKFASPLLAFGPYSYYREVFDPYVEDDPVGTTIGDDVQDVYSDVRRALALWEAGHRTEAVWDWRFNFDIHWGDHAIDALRALHRAVRRAREA